MAQGRCNQMQYNAVCNSCGLHDCSIIIKSPLIYAGTFSSLPCFVQIVLAATQPWTMVMFQQCLVFRACSWTGGHHWSTWIHARIWRVSYYYFLPSNPKNCQYRLAPADSAAACRWTREMSWTACGWNGPVLLLVGCCYLKGWGGSGRQIGVGLELNSRGSQTPALRSSSRQRVANSSAPSIQAMFSSKNFQDSMSHQRFRHMYRTLNIDKKN
jgi:hypothetical protein